MSGKAREGDQIVKLGRWIGGCSTLLVTALLPCWVWWQACGSQPTRLRGALLGSAILLLLLALGTLGAAVGGWFAPMLARCGWWVFPLAGCAPGAVMTAASAMALAIGTWVAERASGTVTSWKVVDFLAAVLAFSVYGLFIGLPWGLLTSTVIRIWGRCLQREAFHGQV